MCIEIDTVLSLHGSVETWSSLVVIEARDVQVNLLGYVLYFSPRIYNALFLTTYIEPMESLGSSAFPQATSFECRGKAADDDLQYWQTTTRPSSWLPRVSQSKWSWSWMTDKLTAVLEKIAQVVLTQLIYGNKHVNTACRKAPSRPALNSTQKDESKS